MCGIAAIFNQDLSPVERSELAAMASTLRHRGPDGAGYCTLPGDGIGLAHTRLAIIDPAGGAQPLWDTRGEVVVVCNGEIYDNAEHRRRLEAKGHRFRTGSDTELLLALYRDHGDDLLDHIVGEFAFVLWDRRRKRLLAARDPMGVKPLFWWHQGGRMVFASEAKAILALDGVERRLARGYFAGSMFGVWTGHTPVFEGIAPIPPGHRLTVEQGREPQIERYFQMRWAPDSTMSFEDAASGLREQLERAVKRRLVADVPVCTYLSGGIDSTAITALAARARGTDRLRAFTIAFSRSEYDESNKARASAKHLGVDIEVMEAPQERIAEDLVETTTHCEIPLANPNSVGKLQLSRMVYGRGFPVTLTGEGADELFAGYPSFKLEALWRFEQSGGDPARLAELWQRFRTMEARSEGLMWNRKSAWKTTEELFGYPSFLQVRAEEYGSRVGSILNLEGLGLGPQDTPASTLRRAFDAEGLRALDPLAASLTLSQAQLAGYIIPTLGDRVEMAGSVEGRTPFLDRDLVQFVGTIPTEHLLDLGTLREKKVLHGATADLMPPTMKGEHKHPFLAPGWRRLASTPAGNELFSTCLSTRAIRDAGILNPKRFPWLRRMWRLAPAHSATAKRLDVLMGVALGIQILHREMVQRRPTSDSTFSMVEMPPPRAAPRAQSPARLEL